MQTTSKLPQFDRQNYLNLETFRRTGEGVKTPVWFVEDGGAIYVSTRMDSGKVKRARRNPRVRVVPCDMRGAPKGEWLQAHADLVNDPAVDTRVNALLNRKYSLLKWIFERMGSKNPAMITIKITV